MFAQTASKDSDSLIHESYQYSPSYYDPDRVWWKHPRVQENWKVVAAAFALVVIGLGKFFPMAIQIPVFNLVFSLGLVTTGIAVLLIPLGGVQGLVFLITGVICFIPGAYVSTYNTSRVKHNTFFSYFIAACSLHISCRQRKERIWFLSLTTI